MIQTKYKHIVYGVYEQKCKKELSVSNLSVPSKCELWYIRFLLKMLVKRMYFHTLHGMGGDVGVGGLGWGCFALTLLHSEQPKLFGVLAVLSATGLLETYSK